MKDIFIDVETTGLNTNTCAIWQLSGIIEIDGIERETFNLFARPDPDQTITLAAMGATGYSLEKLMKHNLSQEELYIKFLDILDSYINKFDKNDKFNFIGYNSHSFDSNFIRRLFTRNNNNFYGSYFYHPSIDVMILAAFAAIGQRDKLSDFKLTTVAESLGLTVDVANAHDAQYDVKLTKDIYKLIQEECG